MTIRGRSWMWAAVLLGALTSAATAQNGLLGEYYNFGTGGSPQPPPGSPAGGSFTATPVHRRIDPQVNFTFTMNPGPAPGVNADHFVVAWSGFLTPPETGTYQFGTTSDDGIRFWVDGAVARDDWADQGESGTPEAGNSIALTQGVAVTIRVEMYENAGGEGAKIFWALPSGGGLVVIPGSALTPPPGPAAPPAPNAVAGYDSGGNPMITVTWTGAAAGITFDLERSINGGAYMNVLSGTTATTYVDTTGLVLGLLHCYRVRAIQDGLLVGPFSGPGCATPQPPPPRTNDHTEGFIDDNCACGSTIGAPWASIAALALLGLASLSRRVR
jgi:hypothetical protein